MSIAVDFYKKANALNTPTLATPDTKLSSGVVLNNRIIDRLPFKSSVEIYFNVIDKETKQVIPNTQFSNIEYTITKPDRDPVLVLSIDNGIETYDDGYIIRIAEGDLKFKGRHKHYLHAFKSTRGRLPMIYSQYVFVD